MEVKIEEHWKEVLKKEFEKPYFHQIAAHLKMEKNTGAVIFPAGSLIFHAFTLSPFDQVKIVILGQDPYHGPGQAHGLSFSVPAGIRLPPSLRNIYKELQQDLGLAAPAHGDLSHWAKQGVLLLNSILTVRSGEPASHAKIGWTNFTDAVIKAISEKKQGVIFLLWGSYAQQKQELIDSTRHFVLKAAHPSPFSADKGFFGCRHFSKANEILVKQGIDPINWKLN